MLSWQVSGDLFQLAFYLLLSFVIITKGIGGKLQKC